MKFTQCIELKLFNQLYIIKSISGSYWSKLLVNLLVFNMFLVSFNHGNNLFRKWKQFVSYDETLCFSKGNKLFPLLLYL